MASLLLKSPPPAGFAPKPGGRDGELEGGKNRSGLAEPWTLTESGSVGSGPQSQRRLVPKDSGAGAKQRSAGGGGGSEPGGFVPEQTGLEEDRNRTINRKETDLSA